MDRDTITRTGAIGRAMETAASFEARFAPPPYPATYVLVLGGGISQLFSSARAA